MLATVERLAEWFHAQPFLNGYWPENNSARHGWHMAELRYARLNVSPCAANRSIFGVRAFSPPYSGSSRYVQSSAMTIRKFGRSAAPAIAGSENPISRSIATGEGDCGRRQNGIDWVLI